MRIRVIDLEATGENPAEHGICEIGFVDLYRARCQYDPDASWCVGRINSWLTDPGRSIPPETSAIHHIVDEDVIGTMPWRIKAAEVCGETVVEAFAAHSAKFERAFLEDVSEGRPWICTYKCALRLWPDAPSHSNQALRYWRNPPGLLRQLAMVAHRAGPDAYVTAFHLRDMLGLAPIEVLTAWSSEPALQIRCHIGQWRGRLWTQVDEGFLHWVSQRDFDEDTLFTVNHELDRREAEWNRQKEAEQIGGSHAA